MDRLCFRSEKAVHVKLNPGNLPQDSVYVQRRYARRAFAGYNPHGIKNAVPQPTPSDLNRGAAYQKTSLKKNCQGNAVALAFNSVIVGLTFRKSQNFRTFQSCKRLSARAGLFQMKSQISLEGINRKEVISKNRQASVEACRFFVLFQQYRCQEEPTPHQKPNRSPSQRVRFGKDEQQKSAL